ncbi:MAG: hypothetical protein FWF79_06660 [Defluviitaleaceae bacterium]|nr:hypothetical protein [Defluviitaleaceae bacterium]
MYEGSIIFTNVSQSNCHIRIPFGAYFNFPPLITLSPSIYHVFDSRLLNNSALPSAHTVNVSRVVGTATTGNRLVLLSGSNADSFVLSTSSSMGGSLTLTQAILQSPQGATFTVQPKPGLPVGMHTATVTVFPLVATDIPQSFNVSFTVYAPEINISIPDLDFDGMFNYNTLRLSTEDGFIGNVFVEINKHNTLSGESKSDEMIVNINASEINITPDLSVRTFDAGEYIEILIYENNTRQNLFARQIVRPVLFEF